MSEFDHRPLNEDFEAEQNVEAPTMLEMENLEQDLQGAAETEGADVVRDALAQVTHRTAPPEALIAWIDELRDPEILPPPDTEVPTGFIHDFEADTEMAGGTLAVHDGDGEDLPVADEVPHAGGGDDDDASDYLFSATRRRRAEDEEDDEGSPAGEGGDKVKPAATTKAPKPSSSNKP